MALFGGKPLSRLDELKKIVTKDPSSRQFLALAEEYRKMGRLREAMETLERGIQATPGYVAAYVALGRTCQQMGLPDQAIQAYGSALKFDRENLVAIRQIADAYLKKGEKVEAIKKLKLFRALKSGDHEVEQLIQQLDAELNPSKPKPSADAWPTGGGLRSPARPPASPFAPPVDVPSVRYEAVRPPLERSGSFARRDFPRPPDFAAAPYPQERPPEEPSPLLTSGRIDRPAPIARVDSPRPVPPPVVPVTIPVPAPVVSRPAPLADSPVSRPIPDLGAIAEPRPLPRRDLVPPVAPVPGAPVSPASLGPTAERTGPIPRAHVPSPVELLELTFDGATMKRTKAEPPSPVSTAELLTPARTPPATPDVPPSPLSSRPITRPIPEVAAEPAPMAPPPAAVVTPPVAPPVPEPESVFDFDEEALAGATPVEAAVVEPAAPPPAPVSGIPLADVAAPVGDAFAEAVPEPTPPAEEPLPWDLPPETGVAEGGAEPFALEAPSEPVDPGAPAGLKMAEEPSPFEPEAPPLVSETLAELYRSQGHVAEARDAYDVLAASEPDEGKARELEARAAALSDRLARSRALRQWAARLPAPPRAEIESLGEVLDALVSGTEGVTGASLTDLEGVPVVSAGDPAIETLVAELTAFWKGVQRVRDELGAGRLQNLTVAAGDGNAVVAAASPEYSLIVRTGRGVPLGRIRYEVGRVSALLGPVLG